MKVDIITRHSVPNYGSLLQSYANCFWHFTMDIFSLHLHNLLCFCILILANNCY